MPTSTCTCACGHPPRLFCWQGRAGGGELSQLYSYRAVRTLQLYYATLLLGVFFSFFSNPPGPNSAAARVISQNHGCTLRQHCAAVSLLKVPSQRTAVIFADPAVHSRRCADLPEADLRRSIGRRLITRPAGPAGLHRIL